MQALEQQYDIVHLLCRISSTGAVGESASGAAELIDKCCAAGIKLLWIASDNDAQGYIKGFPLRGRSLNLVMTLKRNRPQFAGFVANLLARMSQGESMPVAWNQLFPQVPGASHAGAPETIVAAGRGGVRLRR